MPTRIVISFIVWIVLLPICTMPGYTADARFSYLTTAANEITAIDHGSVKLTSADSARIAKIACSALERLVKDPDFEKSLRAILSPDRSNQNLESASKLLDNLRAFDDEFLRTEQKNLEAAGLDFPTTIDALALTARSRKQTSTKGLSATNTIAEVLRQRDAACKLQQQLTTEQQARLIRRGILGTVVVLADVSVAIVSGGTTSAIALASVGVGTTIMYDSAEALTKN